MIRELVRLRNRNQLTLPTAVSEKLGIQPGSLLELTVSDAGHVELRHARVVTAGTTEAKREEARAEKDVSEGRFVTLKGSEDVRQHMRQLRGQETARKLAEEVEALQQRMESIDVAVKSTRAAIQEIGAAGWAAIQENKVR